MSTKASANATAVYYCKQDAKDALPASPVFTRLPTTGNVPSLARDALTSAELDGSPDVKNVRLGSYTMNYEASIESKYGAHDDLFAGLLQGTWTTGNTVTSASLVIDADAKTVTYPSADVTSSISVGDYIVMPGMTDSYNIGPHLVTAIAYDSTDTVITIGASVTKDDIHPRPGLVDETAASTIITSDKLILGTTKSYFAILVAYTDFPGGTKYELVYNCQATDAALSVTVNSMTTGSITFMGEYRTIGDALPAGANLTDASSVQPFSGIDGCLIRDNVKVGYATGVDISISRNATADAVICDQYMDDISYGTPTITFSPTLFFQNYDFEDDLINDTSASYSVAQRLDNKLLAFSFGAGKTTELTKDVSDGNITISATVTPYKASGSESSIIMHRVSAA